MRVGDNYNDFNDTAVGSKLNPDRNKLLNDNLKLFGNFDTSVKVWNTSKQQIIKLKRRWNLIRIIYFNWW